MATSSGSIDRKGNGAFLFSRFSEAQNLANSASPWLCPMYSRPSFGAVAVANPRPPANRGRLLPCAVSDNARIAAGGFFQSRDCAFWSSSVRTRLAFPHFDSNAVRPPFTTSSLSAPACAPRKRSTPSPNCSRLRYNRLAFADSDAARSESAAIAATEANSESAMGASFRDWLRRPISAWICDAASCPREGRIRPHGTRIKDVTKRKEGLLMSLLNIDGIACQWLLWLA